MGPQIFDEEKAAKSAPRVLTFRRLCRRVWAVSSKTRQLYFLASLIIFLAGRARPSKLEVREMVRRRERWVLRAAERSENLIWPLTVEMITVFTPLFLRASQGRKLELCSLSVVKITSPDCQEREWAIKLILSVVFLVKIISSARAPIKLAIVWRAAEILALTEEARRWRERPAQAG